MVNPQTISIDTSVFGDIASDYYGNDGSRRALAHDTISFMIDNSLIPFFSLHHLVEHLQHRDARVVTERLSLIGALPAVSWVRGGSPALPGSIIDVMGTELSLTLQGKVGSDRIIAQARQDMIQYGSGDDLLSWCGDTLMIARELGCFQTQKSKVIDSLLHIMDPAVSRVKVSDLKGATRRSPSDAIEQFRKLKVAIESELVTRGDKKLNNAKGVADRFVQEVQEESLALFQDSSLSFYDHLLQSHGLCEADIDDDFTMGDLGEMAVLKKQVSVVARSYDIDIEEAAKVPIKSMPSGFIVSEIEKSIRKEKRANGSNIADKYMAVFSLYADYNIFDKRINEYFRQLLRKNDPIVKHINNVVKVSHYSGIESCCEPAT